MSFPVNADALRFAAPLAVLAALGLAVGGWWLALPFGLLLVATLGFFRDPHRSAPDDPRAFVAAADGKVTDVEPDWPGDGVLGPGPRVGVFLSVLDVHINRAPTQGEVISTQHAPGKFLNALKPESATANENNLIRFRQGDREFAVRQIAGAIARRIVCGVRPGDRVARGERIGHIRFGSRTEHYLPAGSELCVRPGDRVRGGETILGWIPAETDARIPSVR
jgi:phosphatidylserine decarboxylase